MPNNTLNRLQLDIKVVTGGPVVKRVEGANVEVAENDWEEMLDIICQTLSTDRTKLARRAKLHPSTLMKGTRSPRESIVLALWEAILQMAREQDSKQNEGLLAIFESQAMKDAFYNAADRLSPEQKIIARQRRRALMEVRQLDLKIAQRDRLLREKSAELEALQSDKERRAQALQLLQEIEEEKNSAYTRCDQT